MKPKLAYSLIIFLLLISCSPNTNNINVNEFEIPELIEYYDAIIKEAEKWSPDAYLYIVSIPFGKRPWLLTAGFYSPTKDNESLEIQINLDGKIIQNRFLHEFGVVQEEPIL